MVPFAKKNIMKTATKKIVLTAKGEINKNVLNAINACSFNLKENKIYPVSYSGSGRFISKRDFTFSIKSILVAQGYKFTTGNDAPRGGENGNFILVSKTALNFIKNLSK